VSNFFLGDKKIRITVAALLPVPMLLVVAKELLTVRRATMKKEVVRTDHEE